MSVRTGQGGKGVRAALAAAIALTLVSVAPARAADDDDDTADTKFFRGLLSGLGLKSANNPIDYHERSPLVVPPSRELPAPGTEATIANNPAWPKDPDVSRSKKVTRKKIPNKGGP